MIVITSDQVASRSTPDAVAHAIDGVQSAFGPELILSPERTAGDEIQLLVDSGAAALDVVLWLARFGDWSTGIGIGTVRQPLGASIRESTGAAFIAARTAVERAKNQSTRLAVESPHDLTAAADLEALLGLLLILRKRRSQEGWELFDLVRDGVTQADAAVRLGITPQSASKRARAAEIKTDLAATAALARLIDDLNGRVPAREETTP
jgi:hypothetical protein